MSLFRESTVSFVSLIIANICYLVIGVMIARALGPEGKGAWAIILMIIDYLALLSNLGLDAASVYYLGQGNHSRGQILSVIIYATIGLGLIALFIFTPIIWLWGDAIFAKGEFDAGLSIGAVLIVPLVLGLRLISSYFQGCLKIVKYNLLILIQLFFQIISLYLCLVILKWQIWGIFISYVASLLIAIGMGVIFLFVEGIGIEFHNSLALAKKMLHYGFKGYIGNLIQFVNYKVDLFLVNLLLGLSATGIYSIAVNLASLCWFVSYAMATSLFPRASASGKSSAELINRSASICLLLTGVSAGMLALICKPAIRLLYGEQFLLAAKAIYVLLPGVVIFVYTRILATYFSGNGRPLINSAISLASLAVSIPLNLILIPRLGLPGAALAITLAYIVSSGLSYLLFKFYPIDHSFEVLFHKIFRLKKAIEIQP
ncbi:MAG: oligosaccharide flippase family protein [candidate division KSB1 bacterium]|nr:oligosaccharide flippase family protein [candidate division KSB1 bacterium]MDZ7358217.1 oligosaccharide flippase family protein [candidate division KSB1 bacterium]MDZ7376230.1 oligosaccharide flippase family protein [candidate division KSB1 bacterium]MDZ7399643.1 oligosaccharide flippase family protein [candidate division KSB1 bacterium]